MKYTVCSAASLEELTTLINKYYYSLNYIVTPEFKVMNTKTEKVVGDVVHKKNGRFERFYFLWVH